MTRVLFLVPLRVYVALAAGVVMPLSALYSLDSFLLFERPTEFAVVYVCAMFLLVGALVAAAAVQSGVLLALGMVTGTQRRERVNRLVTLAVSVALVAGTLAFLIREWIRAVLPAVDALLPRSSLLPVFALTLIAVMVAVLHAVRTRPALEFRLGWLPRVAITLTLLAGAVAALALVRPVGEGAALSAPAQARADAPNVFLISLDALSARHMSLYGYPRPTTTGLSRFAPRFTLFERAYSGSNFTSSSIGSLLTGTYPWSHAIQQHEGFMRAPLRQRNLAAELHNHGYTTAAFVANPYAHPVPLRVEGFDIVPPDMLSFPRARAISRLHLSWRFDVHNAVALFPFRQVIAILDRFLLRGSHEDVQHDAERVFAAALAHIDARAGGGAPLFVWTHIYPPHHPYLPPDGDLYFFNASRAFDTIASQNISEKWFDESDADSISVLRDRYDETVRYADRLVAQYLQALDDRGLLENALVIVTADHGESFSHGFWGHGGPLLHDGLIQVPLMIHLPGAHARARCSEPVHVVDVLPTVLQAAGLSVPSGLDGESLTPFLAGGAPPAHRLLVSMNLQTVSTFDPIDRGSFAVIDGPLKYVRSGRSGSRREALYNVIDDPAEVNDLLHARPQEVQKLSAHLDASLARINALRDGSSPGEVR